MAIPVGVLTQGVYCPVAVAPQVTSKFSDELAGRLVSVMPAPGGLCRLATVTLAAIGHTAEPEPTVQLTAVQLRPVTAGSLSTEPDASAGPRLATVTV